LTIEIVCDGGSRWGLGHLRRSQTLAHALSARGHDVRIRPLSDEADAQLDTALTRAERAGGGHLRVRVIDLPYEGDQQCEAAHGSGAAVVGLDYQGESDPDVSIDLHPRDSAPRARSRLVGLDFAMIRPDVVRAAQRTRQGVVVMLGGADVTHSSDTVAVRLQEAGEDVTVVRGPAARPARSAGAYRTLQAPPNVADIMASAAWAVTNGGTTMLEMLCLGTAVHVLPQTADEDAFARYVLRQGGLLGVGLADLSPPTPEQRRAATERGPVLVDGRGAARVADVVEGML
jgi:spore coat polysaccharide biosynthesis predicted glycosyltransferase SpsG